jgi:hypothetical protein
VPPCRYAVVATSRSINLSDEPDFLTVQGDITDVERLTIGDEIDAEPLSANTRCEVTDDIGAGLRSGEHRQVRVESLCSTAFCCGAKL